MRPAVDLNVAKYIYIYIYISVGSHHGKFRCERLELLGNPERKAELQGFRQSWEHTLMNLFKEYCRFGSYAA
jgi:hypothetical protein